MYTVYVSSLCCVCSGVFVCVCVCARAGACVFVCVEGEVTLYQYGWRDCATILFYFFITIILHAVVQEYILDVSLSLCISLLKPE